MLRYMHFHGKLIVAAINDYPRSPCCGTRIFMDDAMDDYLR